MATQKRVDDKQRAKQQRKPAKRLPPKKKGVQSVTQASRDELPETSERSAARRRARRRA